MCFGVNQGPGFKPGCPAVVGGVVMGVKPAGKVGGGPDVDFIEIPGVECVNPVHRQGGKKITPVKPGFSVAGVGLGPTSAGWRI